MNKIYKIIWSKTRNCYVVVSEYAKRNGKCSSSMNKKLIAAFLAAGTVLSVSSVVWAEIPEGTATGTNAVAIGKDSSANGTNALTIGASSSSKGTSAIVVGAGSIIDTADYALIFGTGNTLKKASYSTVIGTGNTVNTGTNTFTNDLVFGRNNSLQTYVNNSTVIGLNNTLNFSTSNIVVGEGQTLEGSSPSKLAKNNIVMGLWDAKVDGAAIKHTPGVQDTVMIGHNADAKANYAVALGTGSIASATNGTALGYKSSVSAADGVALGSNSLATVAKPSTSGYDPATGKASSDSKATWRATLGAVSVGVREVKDSEGTQTTKAATRQIVNVAAGSEDTDAVNVAQLKNAQTHYYSVKTDEEGATNNNFFNNGATGNNAIAIGPKAKVSAVGGVSLGYNASVTKAEGIAMGDSASVTYANGTALGYKASVSKEGGVALGANSTANTDGNKAGYDFITKKSSTDTGAAWKSGTGAGAVSVGKSDMTRQITYVAAGYADTDAVNVAQLKQVATAADNAKTHYVSIKSTSTAAGSNYANDGATGTDAIAVGLKAKAEKNYGIAIGSTSSVTESGTNGTALGYGASVTVADGVALGSSSIASVAKPTTSGYDMSTGKASTQSTPVWRATLGALSVGDAANNKTRQITNVAAGSEDTDAVNVAQLKTAKTHYFGVKSTNTAEGSNYNGEGATAIDAIAIGNSAAAKAVNSIAIGKSAAVASGKNAIAIGADNTITSAEASQAIGNGNTITYGLQNTVIGSGQTLAGTSSSSSNQAKNNVVLGSWDAKTDEEGNAITHAQKLQDTVMIGHNADAQANYGVAIGSSAVAKKGNALSVGYKANAGGTSSVALGDAASAAGNSGVAVGRTSDAANDNSTAVGYGAKGQGNNATAIGYNSKVTETNGTALGSTASVSANGGVALGNSSTATVASGKVGYDMANADHSKDTTGVWKSQLGAVSVGVDAVKNENGSIKTAAKTRQIVNVAAGTEDTDAVNVAQLKSAKTHYFAVNSSIKTEGSNYDDDGASGSNAIAIGAKAGASKTSSIAVGYESVADGIYGAALGYKSNVANKNGIALGNESSVAGDYGVALGSNSAVTEANGMALGYKSSVSMADGIALGSNSAATVDKGVEGYDISGRTHTYDRTGTWISTLGALSVGDAANNKTRQITNVAAGSADTDAVNVAQLKKVTDVINSGVDSVKTHYYSINATTTDEGSNYNNDGAEKYKDENGVLRTSNGIAIGVSAKTQRQNAIAIGTNARVLFSDQDTYTGASWVQANGIALGTNATVLKPGGIAIGSGASTGSETPNQWGNYGNGGIAIGNNAKALGTGAVALGTGSVTEGDQAYTHGGSARAIGNGATAWGLNTLAGNPDYVYGTSSADVDQGSLTTAWGSAAQATGNAATAWGGIYQWEINGETVKTVTVASGRMATAFGQGTNASGWAATTWGGHTEASGTYATAFGNATNAAGDNATAWGDNTKAGMVHYNLKEATVEEYTEGEKTKYKIVDFNGNTLEDNNGEGFKTKNEAVVKLSHITNATAFGYSTTAIGNSSTAFGQKTLASGTGATAFGYKTVAAGNYATAFGQNSEAYGTNSLAILGGTTGEGSVSTDSETGDYVITVSENAQGALAAGEGAQALKSYTYAIGNKAVAQEADTVAIGNGSKATAEGAIVFGKGSTVSGEDSIAIGKGHTVSGKNSGAFGDPSTISGDGSYAIGNDNTIEVDDGFILGSNASVTKEGGVALGRYAVASTDAGEKGYDPLTNKATTETDETWVSTAAAVSVGGGKNEDNKIVTRQITNVAAGSADTDAVNVAQLKAAQTHYYSTNDKVFGVSVHKTNYNNDGATGTDSLAAGVATGTNGMFSAVAGAYSSVSGKATTGTTTYEGTGASVYGSFNEVSADGGTYDGVGNGVVGLANTTNNANGALIFGTGNKITNSYGALDDAQIKDLRSLYGKYVVAIQLSGVNSETAKTAYAALKEKMDEFGVSAPEKGGDVLAIGGGNTADYAKKSSMIGVLNRIEGTKGTEATEDTEGTEDKFAEYNSAIGYKNTIKNGSNNSIIGTNRTVTDADGVIVIGSADEETTTNVADAVAIGTNANVSKAGGVALGSNSIAETDKEVAGYDPVTGKASEKKDATWKSTAAAVSVGGGTSEDGLTITRQITNVAAGMEDTDAVNVAQLKATRVELKQGTNTVLGTETEEADGHTVYTVNAYDTQLESGTGVTIEGGDLDTDNVRKYTVKANMEEIKESLDPLKFGGDNTTPDTNIITRKMGQQLDIVGGANPKNLTDDNIAVISNGIDTLEVKLSDKINLTTDGSLTVGEAAKGATVVYQKGIRIIPETGTSMTQFTSEGISAGNQKIEFVKAGEADTDAVNVSQLKKARTTVTAGANVTSVNEVPPTDIDGNYTYKIDVDDLSYKVGTNEAKSVKLKDGLHFVDGTNTTAVQNPDGSIQFNATHNKLKETATVTPATDSSNAMTAVLEDVDGNKTTVALQNTYTTGVTYDAANKKATFNRNDGKSYDLNLSDLSATDYRLVRNVSSTDGSYKMADDGSVTLNVQDQMNPDKVDQVTISGLMTKADVAGAKTEVKAGTNVAVVPETDETDGHATYTVNADGAKVSKGSDAVTVTPGEKDANNVIDYAVDLSDATKATLDKVENKGLTFAGDSGTSDEIKLGDTLNVKGDSNITTAASGNQVTIALNKDVDLTSAGSLTIGDTKIEDAGITIQPASGSVLTKFTNNGISAGNQKIEYVAAGEADTDAVNVSQLKKARTTVTAGANVTSVNEVPPTDIDGNYTYKIDVDNLSYKANGSNAQSVKLSDGLNFSDGTNTTAVVEANGVVKINATHNKVTGGTATEATDTSNAVSLTLTDEDGNTIPSIGLKNTYTTVTKEGNTVTFSRNDGVKETISLSDLGASDYAVEEQKVSVDADGKVTLKASDRMNPDETYNVVIDGIATKDDVAKKIKFADSTGNYFEAGLGEEVNVVGEKGVTVTTNNSNNTYTIGIDGAAAAAEIPLTYKANGSNAQSVKLSDGLNFSDGTNTTAVVEANGVVKINATHNKITGGTATEATDTSNAVSLTLTDEDGNTIPSIGLKNTYTTVTKEGNTVTFSRNDGVKETISLGDLGASDYRLVPAEGGNYKADEKGVVTMQVKDALNENASPVDVTIEDVASKAQQDTNTQNIATNTENISTNTQNIAANRADIDAGWNAKAGGSTINVNPQHKDLTFAGADEHVTVTADDTTRTVKVGVTGLANEDLSNITEEGETVITNIARDAVTVKGEGGIEVTQSEDKSTYTAKAKLAENLTLREGNIDLANVVKIGNGTDVHTVTIDGTKGEVTGLTNTTWSKDGVYNAGRAATEEQLQDLYEAATKDAVDSVKLKFEGETGDTLERGNNETLQIVGDGTNITTKAADGKIKVELAKDLNVDSVTAGNTVINNEGVKADKVTVGGTTIEDKKITLGDTVVDDASVTTGSVAADDAQIGNTTIDKDGIDTNKVTVGDVTINNDGLNIEGGPSVTKDGVDAGGSKITNVAKGTEDTDAVNLSQLKEATAASKTEVVKGTNIASVESSTGSDGQTIYTVNADGASVSGSDAITVTKGAKDAQNVTDYKVDLSDKTKETLDKVENEGLTFAGDTGASDVIKLGDTLNLKGGATGDLSDGNIGVEAKGNTLNIKLAKDIKDVDTIQVNKSITAGDTVINNDGVTANTFKAGDTTVSNDGLTIVDGPSITKTNVDMGSQQIHNVQAGTADTDAVNYGQLKNLAKNTGDAITNVSNQISKVDDRMKKGLAGAAALAALHPMDFDPDSKLTFAAGVGNYRGANAGAVGAFYRPDERVMFSMGGSFGNGENMVNAGVSFALDRVNRISNTRTAMAHEIVELRDHIAKQDDQIAKLTALVNKLVGPDQAVTNPSVFPDVPENHWAYEYVADLQRRGALVGYPDGLFKGDRAMTRYEFAAMLDRAMQNGVKLDERAAKEFEPELGRIYIQRISGQDNDRNKIERVRVNNYDKATRDMYGSKISTAVPVKAASK